MADREYELPDVWNIPQNTLPKGFRHYYHRLGLENVLHRLQPVTLMDLILRDRERIDAVAFTNGYEESINLQQQHPDLVVLEDPYGVTRESRGGKAETYLGKLEKLRQLGVNESASCGIGEIDGKRIAAFVSHWNFMGASSGAVYGKKIELLMELAIKEDLPVFMLLASGGQRQQEAAGALIEMNRSGHYIRKFQRSSEKPIVAVPDGDLWGGVLASVKGDVIAAVAGTNIGFAGPDVTKRSTGKLPPAGMQTAEFHFLTNRTVHLILRDQQELTEFQRDMVSFAYRGTDKQKKSSPKPEARGLYFDTLGFHTPLQSTVNREAGNRAEISIVDFELAKPDTVLGQHYILRFDPRRPDTEYCLQNSFDDYIPFYSHWIVRRKDGVYQRSPAIIAALAYIDDPRLSKRLWTMVIGNQPNYLLQDDGRILKESASATRWDYHYQLDLMKAAARWRVPLVSFIDTLGADSTTKANAEAQFRGIDDCLAAIDTFPGLELGYLIGNGGSGGALATLFNRDRLRILDDGQLWIAVPDSSASMIIKNPTQDDVERIATQMRPGADSLLELGIVDGIIDTEGGAQNNPYGVALKIREAIITDYLELGQLSTKQLLRRGEERLNQLRPIPIGYLNPRTEKTSLFSRVLKRISLRN